MTVTLIDKLRRDRSLSPQEYAQLLGTYDDRTLDYAAQLARQTAQERFGTGIYIRGLIEITNYCRNDCYYCGIRCGNRHAVRYRLSREEILGCCRTGYAAGFRTFVMQGGEDPILTDEWVAGTVRAIKAEFPDCAVTLSLGEREEATYRLWREAGADRYLLRHETADQTHYRMLHPARMSFRHRMECLSTLRDLGYQTGTGIMVGSPGQTVATLVEDLLFIGRLKPQMIGIGPYLPQHDTPFADRPAGSLELTLLLLSVFRLMFPDALIPSTTALATISPDGRTRGILAGANVVMPNLSPVEDRSKYSLYDNKKATGGESAEGMRELEKELAGIGYRINYDRGDYAPRTI